MIQTPHNTLHLEQLHPTMTVTNLSLRESDQRRHSGSVGPAYISDDITQCKSSTVVPGGNFISGTLSNLSMEDLQTSLQTVMFENGYLAAHVDLLRQQHKYTSQILTNYASSAWVSTAPNYRMQATAANPSHTKKRPAAECAPPVKPDPCDSFPGICADRPRTSASPIYPDFKAFSSKQPACASSACLRKGKRYKQSITHSQHHCFHQSDTMRAHTAKHAFTAACNTKDTKDNT